MLFTQHILTGIALFIIVFALGVILFLSITTIINAINKKRAPYIPIPLSALRQLPAIINPSPNSIVYDLGCGDGRILITLAKQFPHTQFVGIEYSIVPYLCAQYNARRNKIRNVRILKKNFFSHDLSNATHIITYLFPSVMDALLPKLVKECARKTLLFSFDFSFAHKKPEQIITTDSPASGKTIHIYRF